MYAYEFCERDKGLNAFVDGSLEEKVNLFAGLYRFAFWFVDRVDIE
jgi:hypothetical protein